MKKIFYISIIIFSLFIFSACEDKVDNKTTDLQGMWINKTDPNDTIIFLDQLSEPAFEVKRGKEFRGEGYVPKIGSGLYFYELKKDSIYVNYLLSSYYGKIPFHISINNEKNEFSVNGNFTYYPSGMMQFTYRKIEK